MLTYTKPCNVVRMIPRTYGKYTIDVYGRIIDNTNGKEINWIENGLNEYVCELPNTVYDKLYTVEELIALTYKPLYIPDSLLVETELLNRKDYDNIIIPFHPEGLIWRFPNGLVLPMYPEFRVIPGFTRYLASKEGLIYSTISGKIKDTYIGNHGYLACRVTRDDDHDKIMSVHVLIALTWCPYENDVCDKVVDHIDGNKVNNAANNLQWVSYSDNNSRARYHGFYGKKMRKTWIRNIRTGEKLLFDSPASVARYFNVSNSSIFSYLNSPNPYAVFKTTHIIWYDGLGTGEIHPEHLSNRSGSQKRPIDVKNVITGTITQFDSVIDFIKEFKLTRKQVYGNLDRSSQKLFGDIIFKYSDDQTPWKL